MNTTENSVDQDLVAMMSAVFASHREQHDPIVGTASWDANLWNQLAELGLVRLTGSAAAGGSGAGWFEAAELIRAAAYHGVLVPLAEHDLLAGWILEASGSTVDDHRRTFCLLDEAGTAHGVPWAAQSERIVLVWRESNRYRMADVSTSMLSIITGSNSAGEPRDTVIADTAAFSSIPVADVVIDQLMLRAALVRGLQVCAMLDRILELSIDHATERTQFGRPLAKFQAVQNLVADIAAEAALARAATEAALAEAIRTDWSGAHLAILVAVARSCAGHAASVVVRNAHQVHGAIGTTHEHRLHEFTTPALTWRSEYGSVNYWDDKLTTAALSAGSADLWSLVTG